jgi:hypothetical protein
MRLNAGVSHRNIGAFAVVQADLDSLSPIEASEADHLFL